MKKLIFIVTLLFTANSVFANDTCYTKGSLNIEEHLVEIEFSDIGPGLAFESRTLKLQRFYNESCLNLINKVGTEVMPREVEILDTVFPVKYYLIL